MAYTFDIHNGQLSFSNPNYNLTSPVDLNSNSEENADVDEEDDPLDQLYEELDAVCRFSSRCASTVKTRRSYAYLGVESMGVDSPLELDTDNNISLPNNVSEKNNNNGFTVKGMGKDNKTNGFLDYYIGLENGVAKQQQSKKDLTDDGDKTRSSPQESKEEVEHIHGELTDDLYAVPVRKRQEAGLKKEKSEWEGEKSDLREKQDEEEAEELLPPGWERHTDDDGPYYWHISSGTIQREPPACSQSSQSKRISRDLDVMCSLSSFASDSSSSTSSCDHSSSCGNSREEKQLKRRSYPQGKCSIAPDKKPIRFAVRSLGWVEIAEEDLTPERSSRAVNKCIVDLSLGRNDIMDVVGRWGDGKDLYMDLDDSFLQLTDPQDSTVLNTQAIHSIRVWGVGRDNGRERDFAYVARDRSSRMHMCHVFRCDMPARVIANTLRDICKKIMIEKSLQQNLARQVVPKSASSHSDLCRSEAPAQQIFPTPMEEPRKVLKVQYLGSTKVGKPTGMETVNIAIDRLTLGVPPEDYRNVDVAVAPSTVTITDQGADGKVLAECRVRFLSFLGIGRNVKTCAFIVHTAQEHYVAHVFRCEPSSGALCKTIEAACKLRYQKCLDAHQKASAQSQHNKKIGTTIRNVLGTLGTRLSTGKSAET